MQLVFKLEWAMTDNAELIRIILQNYINYFAPKRVRSGCFVPQSYMPHSLHSSRETASFLNQCN